MATQKPKGILRSIKEYLGLGDNPMRPPVGWLLDRQLVTNLREILIFSAFGTRIDPRIWMVGREYDCTRDFEGDEIWFDYMSDSGDGMRATYSIAYLVYSELFVPKAARAGDAVSFESDDGVLESLPRGSFLFVGGDTAYHVADYETLVERFQTPFEMAYGHLLDQGKVDRKDRRPIFGIPGNHDYYDFLDGFNRQFRKPFGEEHKFNPNRKGDQPQLVLGGFERKQWASFVSIELPFGWRMWGFDAEKGVMDRRQRHFFQSMLKDPEKATDRLIVATPEPITKFGQRADPDAAIVQTMRAIGLPCPFLASDPPEQLPAGGCRLDVSGDVHHYARYWGAEPGATEPAHYASVVSGLGGAFLHPSCTNVGEVPSEACYPPPKEALAEVVRRVQHPWMIVLGGRIWLIGLLIAGFLFVAAATSASLRHAMKPLFDLVGLTLPELGSAPDRFGDSSALGIIADAVSAAPQRGLEALKGALLVNRTLPGSSPAQNILDAAVPGQRWNDELYYLPLLFLVAIWGTRRNSALAKRAAKGEQIPSSAYQWPIHVLGISGILSVLWIFGHPGDTQYGLLYPLASNLVVLVGLTLSYLSLLWSRQYDEAMNRVARAKGRLTVSDQVHGWLLWAFTLLSLLLAVTRYGVDTLAVVSFDITFLVVVIGLLFGLPGFAYTVGGELHGRAGKVGFLLLGLWHALLQLAMPLLLVVALPPARALTIGLATAALSWAVGRLAPRVLTDGAANRRWLGTGLIALWVGWIVAVLLYTFAHEAPQQATAASLFTALALGMTLACTFFGQYLAISICFDGHNNEAGGGARIEQWKQFIRFRLTKEGLTGYVIAVDEVEEDGRLLKPRLVDVFEVKPRLKGGSGVG